MRSRLRGKPLKNIYFSASLHAQPLLNGSLSSDSHAFYRRTSHVHTMNTSSTLKFYPSLDHSKLACHIPSSVPQQPCIVVCRHSTDQVQSPSYSHKAIPRGTEPPPPKMELRCTVTGTAAVAFAHPRLPP